MLSIYAVDFAINAGTSEVGMMLAIEKPVANVQIVQSSCRSLIIDTLPIPKQQLGSAWGKRRLSFPSAHAIVESLKQVGWWPSVL